MKRTLLALFLLLAAPLLAQEEETVWGDRNMDHGGYGGVAAKFTSVNGHFGLLVGARGGWIIDHSFTIGAAIYGLANNVRARGEGPHGEPYVNFGYGGLDLEYTYRPMQLMHVSIHTLIGAGAVGYRYGWGAYSGWDDRPDPLAGQPWDRSWYNDYRDWPHHLNVFFVMEPGVTVDFNLTHWFRTSLGASFRVASKTHSGAATANDLTGPEGMILFRFGSF